MYFATMRYALFGYDDYYPLGGWDDLQGISDDFPALRRSAAQRGWDGWQIVDLATARVIASHTHPTGTP